MTCCRQRIADSPSMSMGEWKANPLISILEAAMTCNATNICSASMTSSWQKHSTIGQVAPGNAHASKWDATMPMIPLGAYLGLWQGEASTPQAVAFPGAKALSTTRACDDLHLVHGCIPALGAEHPAHLLRSRSQSKD